MDFDFVEVHGVKDKYKRSRKPTRLLYHSVRNVDGEIIDEAAIHVRYVLKYFQCLHCYWLVDDICCKV